MAKYPRTWQNWMVQLFLPLLAVNTESHSNNLFEKSWSVLVFLAKRNGCIYFHQHTKAEYKWSFSHVCLTSQWVLKSVSEWVQAMLFLNLPASIYCPIYCRSQNNASWLKLVVIRGKSWGKKKKSDRISRKIIQVSNMNNSDLLLVESKECLLMAMQFCVFLHSVKWHNSL